MKKKGDKWDYNLEIFYMYSEYKFEKAFDKDLEKLNKPKRTYEEIEAIVRAERQ